MGGNLKCLITGGAPIQGKIIEFLKVVFSCPLCEGYSQTESTSGGTI